MSIRMNYTHSDLEIADALEFIRKRPEMFTANGVPTPAFIAHGIAGDAIVLGATSVRVFSHCDWWVVSADIDWLVSPCRCPAPPREAFFRMLAFPELAVNSIRHEILANAYASSVVSISKSDRFIVKGDIAKHDEIWLHMLHENEERSVALRMEE